MEIVVAIFSETCCRSPTSPHFAAILRCYLAGEAIANIVDKRAGY